MKKIRKKSTTLKALPKISSNLLLITILLVALTGMYLVYSSFAATSRNHIKLTKIEPSSGAVGTKVTLYSNKLFSGDYRVNINSTKQALNVNSADGGKTLSFIFPATPCTIGKFCAQVVAKPGMYRISITDSQGYNSNLMNFRLTDKQTGHYFEVGGSRKEDTHVIQLNKSEDIQHARNLIAKKTTSQPSVMGIIVKSPVSYNPKWTFYLDPSTITFFDAAAEVCDAGTSYVEEHLAEVGGAFLPGNRWCPWNSYVIREVK